MICRWKRCVCRKHLAWGKEVQQCSDNWRQLSSSLPTQQVHAINCSSSFPFWRVTYGLFAFLSRVLCLSRHVLGQHSRPQWGEGEATWYLGKAIGRIEEGKKLITKLERFSVCLATKLLMNASRNCSLSGRCLPEHNEVHEIDSCEIFHSSLSSILRLFGGAWSYH